MFPLYSDTVQFMFDPSLFSTDMSKDPFYPEIYFMNNLYHHKLSEDPIVTTHQMFDVLRVL